MKKQLIFETKIKLIDYVFQNQYVNDGSISNILDSMLVINDSKNMSSGSFILDKLTDLEFKSIGTPNIEYSLVELKANYPIILKFAVEEEEITLTTSSFSYNNQLIKLKNLQVLNSSLQKNIDEDEVITYSSIELSKNVELRFILIEHYDLKYTTFGDHYV